MKRLKSYFFILPVLLLAALQSCQTSEKPVEHSNDPKAFKEKFIDAYWKIHPVDAIYNGYHNNDSVLTVYDSQFMEFQRKELNSLRKEIETFNTELMEVSDKTDFYMMRDRIEADLWYLDEYRSYEWNPADYNVGGEFAEILSSGFKPLDDRLKIINMRLANVDRYYDAAKTNITRPVKEHTELALIQSKGAIPVFTSMITDSLDGSSLPEEFKNEMHSNIQKAVESIERYVSYLDSLYSTLENDTAGRFHLGRELYEKKFLYDLRSRYTADEIYKIALERKDEVIGQMSELAKGLWSKYFSNAPMPDNDKDVIAKVIAEVSKNHVHRDSFQSSIETQISELASFVNEHDLLYLDPAKPLSVRKTPGYMEGSGAGASISAPGPYDKDANTYYNVSPLTGYTSEMAESYLREYNNFTLQILNIHEAIPGHYAQLVYSNQSEGLIKSILGNGAMVEGWAVYSERMMLEEGYGNNEPELWLMYYKWHLRSVCNTILDYSVHVLGWEEDQAVRFLTGDAFQEEAEARGKWRRVKLTQVQLCSYFTGYTEIYNLREELKKAEGDTFNLRKFHEEFLSYGSAPVKYIRELMLKNAGLNQDN